jgi:hypothetical protein
MICFEKYGRCCCCIDLEGEKKGLEEQVAIMSANLFQGDTIEKERIKKHLSEHLFRIEVCYHNKGRGGRGREEEKGLTLAYTYVVSRS